MQIHPSDPALCEVADQFGQIPFLSGFENHHFKIPSAPAVRLFTNQISVVGGRTDSPVQYAAESLFRRLSTMNGHRQANGDGAPNRPSRLWQLVGERPLPDHGFDLA